jgi:3-hydroxypropanoate dehydrogenase
MTQRVDDAALKLIFAEARTHNSWLAREMSNDVLHRIYDIARMGQTSANSAPARFVFRASYRKQRKAPAPRNVEKPMRAPVTVIVAYDEAFYEKPPRLFPHGDARSLFASSPAHYGFLKFGFRPSRKAVTAS